MARGYNSAIRNASGPKWGSTVTNPPDDQKTFDDDKNPAGNEKPAVTLPGIVEKIVKPVDDREPEKAQIAVHGADELYKEIRIDNELQDGDGEKVKLKPGAQVDVTIEAPVDAVEKKKTA